LRLANILVQPKDSRHVPPLTAEVVIQADSRSQLDSILFALNQAISVEQQPVKEYGSNRRSQTFTQSHESLGNFAPQPLMFAPRAHRRSNGCRTGRETIPVGAALLSRNLQPDSASSQGSRTGSVALLFLSSMRVVAFGRHFIFKANPRKEDSTPRGRFFTGSAPLDTIDPPMSALSRPESLESRLAVFQHIRPETALKILQREHQLIARLITIIERLRALRTRACPLV